MRGLLWLLVFLLLGEALATWTGLPVSGPVIGMAMLLAVLCLRGGVPESIDTAASQLILLLPLFVIPAGVGVLAHLDLVRANGFAIAMAIVLSTSAALLLTGRLAQRKERS
ncbi:MAG: CidA/LrgA family protein [Pseudomonadota bacterium]|nr:CidA/LrgA family protein [Pseudomonadota bacterium]MDE3106439.1 CidA/LrgA family protein [Acidobacteriota bacterium]